MLKFLGIGTLVLVLVFGLVVFTTGGIVIGTLNGEASLRSSIESYERVREASFDTMKKIISQTTQLPAAARDDLLKLLPEVVAGRTGGSIFKSVQEKYPELTLGLYKDIANSIEIERHNFLLSQESLFDASREHNTLLRRPVSGFVCNLFGKKEIEIKVISSTESKEVVKTGVDDDTSLKFGK